VLQLSDGDQGELFLSVYDLSQATALRRLTFQFADDPVWTRDGRIIFQSAGALFWQRADGNGAAEQLLKVPYGGSNYPSSVSRDGKTLLFRNTAKEEGVWTLSLDGDRKTSSLISEIGAQFAPYFSPDDRWVVYVSAETGIPQIFVQPFPPNGTKYQITTMGGLAPLWSPDGKQIFYLPLNGPLRQLLSVDVHTTPSFGVANPAKLPIDKIAGRNNLIRPYDITPDGKRFIVVLGETGASDRSAQTEMRITLNWFGELKRLVPAK
jgi:serine/threonine-protein kinase